MAGQAQGLGNFYVDAVLKYIFYNPSASVWPSAPGNTNTGGFGLSNLYLGICTSPTALDGTDTMSLSGVEPSGQGYARITIPTGSTNWSTIQPSGTASFSLPSGTVAGNTGTFRFVYLLTDWQFPQNAGPNSWNAPYLFLADQSGVGTGNIVGFGPNPNTPQSVGANSILTVPHGTSFKLGVAR